jgi:hypothetical protein
MGSCLLVKELGCGLQMNAAQYHGLARLVTVKPTLSW